MTRAKRAATALLQRAVFCIERFGEHELANHAAAGAYAFLLSAMPAVLLALDLVSALLRARPGVIAEAQRTVASFLGAMATEDAVRAFFDRPLGALAAIIGGLSLLYSARLLIVTIQRGLRVVRGASGKGGVLRDSLLGFALELLALLAVVAILAISEAMRFISEVPGQGAELFFGGSIRLTARLLPAAVLLAFVYINYRLSPSERPSRRTALGAALLCVLASLACSSVFGLFMNGARYNLLYGIFGNLIVLLANVYFFFCFFFGFAELVYVEQNFDALLFARFQRALRSSGSARLERALFRKPERLFERYGRSFARGELVFSAGEAGQEAYFVHSGAIGIYVPSSGGELRLATIEAGDIFGEMALIQGEARSATARAEDQSLVLLIPPEVFELYLAADDGAPRRLIELLSERLRRANERIAADPGADAHVGR
jgi:membrane protein